MAIKGTPKTYKRVMGVDASSNSFAFSIFEDGQLIEWGEIEFKGDSVFKRLHDGQNKLKGLAKRLQVDLIVFESAVFVNNKKTVVLLAYTFGAVVAALMDSGADVKEVPPITWQNAIGNKALNKDEKAAIQKANPGKSKSWYSNKYREERKDRTRQWVKKTFGLEIESDNITDSIGVGYAVAVLGK